MILPKTPGRSTIHINGTTVYVLYFLLTEFNTLINFVDCEDNTGEAGDAHTVIPGRRCTLNRLVIKQALTKWFMQV